MLPGAAIVRAGEAGHSMAARRTRLKKTATPQSDRQNEGEDGLKDNDTIRHSPLTG